MRDLVAALVALVLLAVALALMAALAAYRYRRAQRYREAASLGRRIVAEIPTEADLVLFAEDAAAFYYGDMVIDKARLRAVEVRVNNLPLTSASSPGWSQSAPPREIATPWEGSTHDRWDVVIQTADSTIVVECGAIRDQVSQEIALRIFDAVKTSLPRGADRAASGADSGAD